MELLAYCDSDNGNFILYKSPSTQNIGYNCIPLLVCETGYKLTNLQSCIGIIAPMLLASHDYILKWTGERMINAALYTPGSQGDCARLGAWCELGRALHAF